MKKEKTIHEQIITGIVIANDWDEEGNVIDIVIHSNKAEIFGVTKNELHEDLLNSVRSQVVAKGRVRQLLNGHKLLHINTFELI